MGMGHLLNLPHPCQTSLTPVKPPSPLSNLPHPCQTSLTPLLSARAHLDSIDGEVAKSGDPSQPRLALELGTQRSASTSQSCFTPLDPASPLTKAHLDSIDGEVAKLGHPAQPRIALELGAQCQHGVCCCNVRGEGDEWSQPHHLHHLLHVLL
ncbi:unnamed protein product [Closterium sp. NIES-53]